MKDCPLCGDPMRHAVLITHDGPTLRHLKCDPCGLVEPAPEAPLGRILPNSPGVTAPGPLEECA